MYTMILVPHFPLTFNLSTAFSTIFFLHLHSATSWCENLSILTYLPPPPPPLPSTHFAFSSHCLACLQACIQISFSAFLHTRVSCTVSVSLSHSTVIWCSLRCISLMLFEWHSHSEVLSSCSHDLYPLHISWYCFLHHHINLDITGDHWLKALNE